MKVASFLIWLSDGLTWILHSSKEILCICFTFTRSLRSDDEALNLYLLIIHLERNWTLIFLSSFSASFMSILCSGDSTVHVTAISMTLKIHWTIVVEFSSGGVIKLWSTRSSSGFCSKCLIQYSIHNLMFMYMYMYACIAHKWNYIWEFNAKKMRKSCKCKVA
mgnify:CR=1 FL=1